MSETIWITTSITLDPETKKRLDQLAVSDERSVSFIVRRLVNAEWDRKTTERENPQTPCSAE
jgi:predicted transcriptional regulator